MVGSSDDTLVIRVEDDGQGFDPARLNGPSTKKGGFGLFSIRERLSGIGGSLAIDSACGKGTTASITLPAAAAR